MPLVIVTRKKEKVSDKDVERLGPILQSVVAEALTCDEEDGRLTEKEIEVRFREPSSFDRNVSDLSVEVFANDFPSRRANLQRRTEQISNQLRIRGRLDPTLCTGAYAGNFVWVLLAPAGFAFL